MWKIVVMLSKVASDDDWLSQPIGLPVVIAAWGLFFGCFPLAPCSCSLSFKECGM
jgi:hypothetical protein